MSEKTPIVVGIAWYRREQWSLLLSLIPDAEVFPKSYDEWLAKATGTLRDLSANGVAAQKVDVDVTELIRWTKSRNRAPDGAARAEYAKYLISGTDATSS